MHFDVVITKEEKLYSSWCPQLDIASSGKTFEDARKNLKEAIELYLADAVIPTRDILLSLTSVEVIRHDEAARAVRA